MSYGFRRSKETREVTGEINILRYSALDLWLKSKNAYRRRYYEGESMSTVETVFGHEVHKKLEKGEVVLEGLPRYAVSEYNIEVELPGGLKIGGCLDSFCPETYSFLDYKSSHLSPEGKAPWNSVKVAKHMQLVFYSLLIKLKHGKVNPFTKLVWIETAFQNKSIEFDGHALSTQTRNLALTGKFQVFERRIADWERQRLLRLIKQEAKNIQEDFKQHQLITV